MANRIMTVQPAVSPYMSTVPAYQVSLSPSLPLPVCCVSRYLLVYRLHRAMCALVCNGAIDIYTAAM